MEAKVDIGFSDGSAAPPQEGMAEAAQWLQDAVETGTAAWRATAETCQQVQQATAEGLKVTDETIRKHPYPAIGVAFGAGLLLAAFLKGR